MINILFALNGTFHKGGTEAIVLSYYTNIDQTKYHEVRDLSLTVEEKIIMREM